MTLSPGLTNTAAVQILKIKRTPVGLQRRELHGHVLQRERDNNGPRVVLGADGSGRPPVCGREVQVDTEGQAFHGGAWPAADRTAGVALSGALASGPYSPLSLSGSVSETFTGGSTCGVPVGSKAAKAVKKGTFAGSAVAFE